MLKNLQVATPSSEELVTNVPSCLDVFYLIEEFMDGLLNLEPIYDEILFQGYRGLLAQFTFMIQPSEQEHFRHCQHCRNYFDDYFRIVDEMAVFNDFNDGYDD